MCALVEGVVLTVPVAVAREIDRQLASQGHVTLTIIREDRADGQAVSPWVNVRAEAPARVVPAPRDETGEQGDIELFDVCGHGTCQNAATWPCGICRRLLCGECLAHGRDDWVGYDCSGCVD